MAFIQDRADGGTVIRFGATVGTISDVVDDITVRPTGVTVLLEGSVETITELIDTTRLPSATVVLFEASAASVDDECILLTEP